MGIHTPIDRHFRFGELYGIRRSYSGMVDSIRESETERMLLDGMMAYMVESGNLEKIGRFARKNGRLRDFAFENSITEAVSGMNERTAGMGIPKSVKKKVERALRESVMRAVEGVEPEEFRLEAPFGCSFGTAVSEAESEEEGFDSSGEGQSEEIDKLIADVAVRKGIYSKDGIVQSKRDAEFGKDEEPSEDGGQEVHNYSIREIVLEAMATNQRRTKLIPPTSLYSYTSGNAKDYLKTTIKSVLNGINVTCGINFREDDYTWLASGRPTPFLKAEMVVTADSIRGSRLLNTYFGPAGMFKDYIFRADNTPKLEPAKAGGMSEIDREVNVISAYPMIKVYTTIISWDVVNGEDRLREIDSSDFLGTDVKFLD